MTDAGLETPRLVPPAATERDRILPLILAASLLVHIGVLISLGLREHAGPPPLREIPVELVQLPPPDKAKPPEPKAPAPKPPQPPPPKAPPKQAEQPPAPKPPAPKPEPRKPEPRKQPQKQEQKQVQKAAPSTADRMKILLGQPPEGLGTEPQNLGAQDLGAQDLGGLPGAIALPGQAADGSIAVSYQQLVMSKVAKAKKQGRYPGVPGRTVVAFELTETGDVVNLRIDPPSGNPTLDEEAIEMVKRGAPYPPPPPGARRDFAVGLVFKAEPN